MYQVNLKNQDIFISFKCMKWFMLLLGGKFDKYDDSFAGYDRADSIPAPKATLSKPTSTNKDSR